jgi:hypothetical protein
MTEQSGRNPELDELAEDLRARGLGEGVDFFVAGRSPVDLSSEYIGIRKFDDGGYEVWYRGDWGTDKILVEKADFDAAREVFVEEAVRLAQGRWGSKVGRKA